MQIKSHQLAALLFATATATATASAYAHGTVESATPKNGATLSTPPSEIRLKFSELLEPTFTSLKLFAATGQEVATTNKARVEDGRTVVLALPVLPRGGYIARWISVGHDGHRVHGELTFTVK
jgi:methionine-rich copper-binding protein CopC